MATYNNLSDFSSDGFNIGKDHRVMTYMHGLSDFWVYMFEDASKVNLLMEANAITASDIYNKFLQLTSVISLQDITTLTNCQIKLILIKEADKVDGTVETYAIPKETNLKYAKYLVNRAFLPTAKLEDEADYYIDEALGQISFAQPLADLGFPYRTLTDGSREYAMWAIDAKIDDNLIYDYYAKLININPTTSTENFKNFVYGLYYMFVQGPNLDTVRRGLNLALGIPLARDVETVLEKRKYLTSDQWLVITDRNSYLIPYGLEPSVEEDDLLEVGQEIANWIEVKDYENDGEWWVNFMLPSGLLPSIPPAVPGGGGVVADAQPDRYMTAGSYADWLMRNYLKTHTFLVNVKTVGFKNIQNFEQLYEIIKRVKPSYTTPIYVWTVPTGDEDIEVVEELMRVVLARERCEHIIDGTYRFTRGSETPLYRGNCPHYIRMSGPSRINRMLGNTPEVSLQRNFLDGVINGYIAPERSYSNLSTEDAAWMDMFRTRGSNQYIPKKGFMDFYRKNGLTKGVATTLPVGRHKYDVDQIQSTVRSTVATYFDVNGVLQTAAINTPRFAYDQMGTRINYIRNSIMSGTTIGIDDLPNNWLSAGAPNNLTRSVTDTGVEDGRNFIEIRVQGTPNASSTWGHYFDNLTNAGPGQTWTVSALVRFVGTPMGVTSGGLYLQERNSSLIVVASSTTNVNVVDYSGGPKQVIATRVFNQATTARVVPGFVINYTSGVPVDVTYRLYCPQLEQSAFASAFIPTSNAIGYDPGTYQGLIVEPAATNYVTNSSMVGVNVGTNTPPTGWSRGNWDIVGTGTEDGINYVDVRMNRTNVSGAIEYGGMTINAPFNITPGETYTISAYVRHIAGSTAGLNWNPAEGLRIFEAGANVYTGVDPRVGNGPLRTSRLSFTKIIASTTTSVTLNFQLPLSIGATADCTFRIGLPQIEVGSVVTSPIKTSGATLTRSADTIQVLDYSGIGTKPLADLHPNQRMVYLHTTTLKDVEEKFASVGRVVPSDYYFTLFKPDEVFEAINEHPINDTELNSFRPILTSNFDYYFDRGTWGQYLTAMFGEDSFSTYKPSSGDLKDGDYLAFTRIADDCFGVYWITENMSADTPALITHDESDSFNISYSAPIDRGGAALGSPYYLTRGGKTAVVYNTSTPVVSTAVVNPAYDESTEITVTYSDSINPSFTMDRSGKVLNVSRTWK